VHHGAHGDRAHGSSRGAQGDRADECGKTSPNSTQPQSTDGHVVDGRQRAAGAGMPERTRSWGEPEPEASFSEQLVEPGGPLWSHEDQVIGDRQRRHFMQPCSFCIENHG
jgi:hypothetical protein